MPDGREPAVQPGKPAAPLAGRVRWHFNRLRCMSAAEIAHRLASAARLRAERLGFADLRRVPDPERTTTNPWIAVHIDSAHAERYVAAAGRIAAGRLDIFDLEDAELGNPPRWNRDPRTGIEAPLCFGMLLDYRNPRIVGDYKYLWELNRHLQFVTLAQAWAQSGDRSHLETLHEQLDSWLGACPYRIGPNWSSALEPAMRLINWAIVWQLVGGFDGELFRDARGAGLRDRWLDAVFRHVAFVRAHPSLYSSANNHLIGEATGCLVAAATWPCWPESRTWLVDAHRILESELLLQNAPDGVNREQATGYQLFELDLALIAFLAGEAAGLAWSAAFRRRFEAMFEFLAAIMDVGGHVPAFGDSDDGFVARLSQEPDFCPYRSLLATGAILFGRADFRRKAGTLDDKTRWLLGVGAEERFAKLDDGAGACRLPRAFPCGGYYVLGAALETADEIRLVADAGPLGFGALAAHGHADALSFTLSVGGRELLTDAGTMSYRSDSPWRGHFRGSAAHNVIRIDGRDQSEPGGSFLWVSKAKATCAVWESTGARDVLEGWHDGYLRLPDPVLHRRRIVLDKPGRRIAIEDDIETGATHEVELLFHCSELCRVRQFDGGFEIVNGPATALLRLPQIAGASVELHCGGSDSCFGWRSPRFGVLLAAPTIRWCARLGAATLRTEIRCWSVQTTH